MQTAQRIILVVSNVLLIAALTGLWRRSRMRLVYAFPAYAVAVIVLSSLSGLWPDRFNTWSFYWLKQSVYALLEMGIALELAIRVFQAFPAARTTARGALFLVLAVTLVATWTAPDGPPREGVQQQWADLVLSLHPRIANGTAWLFGALFALILYYRLPLHPLHKAVAFGFMAYLLFLSFGLDLVKRSEFAHRTFVSYASSIGYTLVVAYWARAAWGTDPLPPADPEVVRRLQPWREKPPGDL